VIPDLHFEYSPKPKLETDNRALVRLCKKRGTAERWITEGKQAMEMTRLGCRRFRSNEVRLWLGVLACNPGNPCEMRRFLFCGHAPRRSSPAGHAEPRATRYT
jgi:hypothetical protein